MAAPLLEVHDLVKDYGRFRALDRVSFRVEQGELFGLLGPNGAGKTTLMSILASLLHAGGGAVRLEGQVLDPGRRDLRHLIGIVPQDIALYGELTARENLVFFGQLYGLGGAELRGRVDQLLEAVGLADRAQDRARTYSGGMKRRLNLAAALVHRPKLLLLDEPTVGVDPQSRNLIFEEVRRLNAAGMTMIYTSHYMEEVETLCPRVGIIDHGKLIACDMLRGLLASLPGLILLRVKGASAALTARLKELPDVNVIVKEDGAHRVECRDVKGTVVRVVGLLNELQLELVGLELHEPNLEGVFLHLTGKALRD